MILVDTCVWANHLRSTDEQLFSLLQDRLVVMHPLVLGELACGSLPKRAATIEYMEELPSASIASEEKVHLLLKQHRLWGTGVGWIDMHLLTTAVIEGYRLLTIDRALGAAAKSLGVAHPAGPSLLI